LLRIQPDVPTESEEAIRVDVARTDSLFEYVYRLESAADFGFAWQQHAAITQMMSNYVGGYHRMLAAFADAGDLENSRRMLRNILPLLEFHGVLRYSDGHDRAEMLLTYWKKLDPKNPEVDRWRQRLQI